MKRDKGIGTRYDNDLGGNHLQRERDKCRASTMVFSYTPTKRCTKCNSRKPVKGGSAKFGFVCADCKALEAKQ